MKSRLREEGRSKMLSLFSMAKPKVQPAHQESSGQSLHIRADNIDVGEGRAAVMQGEVTEEGGGYIHQSGSREVLDAEETFGMFGPMPFPAARRGDRPFSKRVGRDSGSAEGEDTHGTQSDQYHRPTCTVTICARRTRNCTIARAWARV